MSILKELESYDGERGRVVSFEVTADKRSIVIEECCDNYFTAALSKAEFGQMIEELKALHARMEDDPSAANGSQAK
jgi:hypothetical protein